MPSRGVVLARAAFVVVAASAAVWRIRGGWAVVTVDGPSMEPTFRHGDRVVVRRTPWFAVSPGSVVVLARPGGSSDERIPSRRGFGGRSWMIKRVAAVAGEPVPDGIPVPDAVVPEGKIIALGDNADASFDSRVVGYFSADLLLGGVVRRMS